MDTAGTREWSDRWRIGEKLPHSAFGTRRLKRTFSRDVNPRYANHYINVE